MSAKATAVKVLNTKAGGYAVAIGAAALALWWLGGKAKAAVVDATTTATPSLYDEAKTDTLVFGIVNVDEPWALTKRIGSWLGLVDTVEDKRALAADQAAELQRITQSQSNAGRSSY